MMSASGGRFLSSLFSLHKLNVEPSVYCGSVIQSRNYAVRKGTREKLLKKKLRNIAAKRAKELKMPKKAKDAIPTDAMKYPEKEIHLSPDNVWLYKLYSWKIYSFDEAMQAHRNTFHPTMYNYPSAKVSAKIELNMRGVSAKKLIGAFHNLVAVPHKFSLEEKRSVLAFVKTPEQHEEAKEAGANLVAGPDIVRLIRIGELTTSDYNSIIAHPSMLPDILCIKGILKNKFPSLKNGTLGVDLKSVINKHLHGIKYSCTPDLHYPEYGLSEISFGTIGMENEQLRENFKALLDSIESKRPKRPGSFITRIRIKCLPNHEMFKLNLGEFIQEEIVQEKHDNEDDDDDEDDDKVTHAEI